MNKPCCCPYCGAENMPGYQFCAVCGQRFEYRCPECGAPVISANKECPGCHSGLHWAITDTQEVSSAPDEAGREHTGAAQPAPQVAKKPKSRRGRTGLWIMFFSTTILVAILIVAALFLFGSLPWGLDSYVPEAVQPQPSPEEPVPPPVLPVSEPDIVSFEVAPLVITAVQDAVLSWEVTEADSVTIDGGIGEVAEAGTAAVSPQADTVYTLTAENAAGSSSRTVQLAVIENTDASAIALTEDDIEGTGFTYKVRISPSIPATISTHEIQFTKGYKLIDCQVLIFETVQAAEDYYFNVKNNNRVDIKEQAISIGQRAFVLHYTSEYEDEDMVYTIKFQKNNVFVSMGRIDDFELLESLARLVESRID